MSTSCTAAAFDTTTTATSTFAMTSIAPILTGDPSEDWFAKARALDERLAATGEDAGATCD